MSAKKKGENDEDSSVWSRVTEDIPLAAEQVEMDEIEAVPPQDIPSRLNHFEVVSEIGSGGMGTVYLARDTSLDREVALKVLSPSVMSDPAAVDRFIREARAQAQINHPNITQIYFIGEHEGYHYFAMELLNGSTLAEILKQEEAFNWETALGYIRQAAKGLSAAHERGVVHHDVKPSNMILTRDDVIKIADFGLAKQIERDSRITGTGIITGTPAYMSPEQARGEHTDHRSDVYSLGASLFHLIAGQPPFEGDTPVGTIVQQITTPPPKLADVVPEVPHRVSDFVARCLQKDPARRYQTYNEVLHAIDEAMPRKLVSAGIYARFSAIIFDLLVIAAICALPFFGNLARVVLYAAYFVLTESLFGWTPGKKMLKLAVRKWDGRRALPARIGLRFIFAHWFFFAGIGLLLLLVGQKPPEWRPFLSEQLPVAILLGVLLFLYLLGLVCMAVSRGKRALHDSLTGTLVIYHLG